MKRRDLRWRAALAIAVGFIAGLILLGFGGLYAVLFAVGAGLAFGSLAMRMAGGMTGDLYGATIEITESLVLLFLAAFAQRGWIDAFAFGR